MSTVCIANTCATLRYVKQTLDKCVFPKAQPQLRRSSLRPVRNSTISVASIIKSFWRTCLSCAHVHLLCYYLLSERYQKMSYSIIPASWLHRRVRFMYLLTRILSLRITPLRCRSLWFREAFFGSRQLKVAEMDGRAGAKKTWNRKETQRLSGRRLKKIRNRPSKKNAIFTPIETNVWADENQKKPSFTCCFAARAVYRKWACFLLEDPQRNLHMAKHKWRAHRKWIYQRGPVFPARGGPGKKLDSWGQRFVPSSDIGSVCSLRPGLRTSDARSDVLLWRIHRDCGQLAELWVHIRNLHKLWNAFGIRWTFQIFVYRVTARVRG